MTEQKEPQVFTAEQVIALINADKRKERMISAMLLAIQRQKMAGDDPIYLTEMANLFDFVNSQSPTFFMGHPAPKPEEKKPEDEGASGEDPK